MSSTSNIPRTPRTVVLPTSTGSPDRVARHLDVTSRRTPRLGGLNLTLLGLEIRRRLRNRRAMIFSLAMPVVFLLMFTTSQDVYQTSGRTDREETDLQAEKTTHSYEGSQVTNVSFSPAQDDLTAVKDGAGNAIETRHLEWTYTGADQQDYRGTMYLRVFTTTHVPVLMRVMYACPAGAYSATELETLMKGTALNDPGPADMDG